MTEKQLERRIKEVYSEATNDLQRKWDDYFERRSKDIAETENALKQAKIDQNQELSSKLEKELEQKKYNLTLGNKQYKDMVAQTTKRIAEANQIAVAYANDAAATFYTQGFNEKIPEVAEAGIRFDMQDEATVRRLIKDGDIQMPKRKLDIPKDERWNTKQINSRVLQGIIQGESMDKIADRLRPIMDNNRASAMRNARTLVNGAENLGRLDRAHELEQNGVVLHKVWIATGDGRTRDIHLEIDGQEVELDEPFIDGNGNELQYPCDPNAEPETVYNCRCTYIRKVVGFVKEDGTVEEVDYEAETEQHKEEIEREQERREEEQEKGKETADESKEETQEEPKDENREIESEETQAENWEDSLTEDEKSAIRAYVSGDRMDVNDYLRKRGYYAEHPNYDKESNEALIKDLDSAIEKYGGLQQNTQLYRSVDASAIYGNLHYTEWEDMTFGQADQIVKNVVGETFVDKGYMSTTKDKELAEEWEDFTGSERPIVLIFDAPQGASAADLSAFDVEGDEQREVLFARNTKYKVTDAYVENGTVYVKADILAKGKKR